MRDTSIDILRSIAIICIVIAHTIQNKIALQIRNFDVPLMVFLSGYCYTALKDRYFKYLWKRFIRLVVPTWIFLTVYIAVIFISGDTIGRRDIFEYYLFQTNWYIWIIRIFCIIAVLSPVLVKAGDAIGKTGFCLVSILSICAISFLKDLSGYRVFQYSLAAVPYCLFFYFGFLSKTISPKGMGWISLTAGLMFCAMACFLGYTRHEFVPTQLYKYPPQLYYVSYATACIGILFILRQTITRALERIRLAKFFSFIGSHTLWMYFYHIFLLFALENVPINGFLRFLSVFLGALLLTWIHSLVFGSIPNKTVKMIFIG